MEFVNLFELQQEIRESLDERFPESLWVKAEVAQVQIRSNGHCYMDLCQSGASGLVAKAKAVIWKGTYASVGRAFARATGSPLAAGMTILALCRVNYSELYGLSLVVEDLEPQFTLGEAEMERRKTVARLEEENLMDRQRELELPDLPYSLAVISARDAAGFGDFCNHLDGNEYGFKFKVTLLEAVMQGKSAPESIADALALAETSKEGYDAVLIMRGGGSSLDLACFDDYSLCLAVACCSLPVFTAIGHDRDIHVADMVAFRSVKTPTALADEFIEAFAAEDARITELAHRLSLAVGRRLSDMENELALLESRIKAADPRQVLGRGYALVTDARGVIMKSSRNVAPGEKITVLFNDGKIEAEVKG